MKKLMIVIGIIALAFTVFKWVQWEIYKQDVRIENEYKEKTRGYDTSGIYN